MYHHSVSFTRQMTIRHVLLLSVTGETVLISIFDKKTLFKDGAFKYRGIFAHVMTLVNKQILAIKDY